MIELDHIGKNFCECPRVIWDGEINGKTQVRFLVDITCDNIKYLKKVQEYVDEMDELCNKEFILIGGEGQFIKKLKWHELHDLLAILLRLQEKVEYARHQNGMGQNS